MLQFPVKISGQREKSYSIQFCHWCKSFLIVHSVSLYISLRNELRLMSSDRSINFMFHSKYSFATGCFLAFSWLYNLSSPILFQCFHINFHTYFHSLLPSASVKVCGMGIDSQESEKSSAPLTPLGSAPTSVHLIQTCVLLYMSHMHNTNQQNTMRLLFSLGFHLFFISEEKHFYDNLFPRSLFMVDNVVSHRQHQSVDLIFFKDDLTNRFHVLSCPLKPLVLHTWINYKSHIAFSKVRERQLGALRRSGQSMYK